MYNTLVQAELMTWHAQNKNIDGMVRHATKSKQWKFVDEKWLEFAMEPINVRLGLAIDGVNMFSEKQSTWSTWSVVLFNYNIPPWLTMKKHFIVLSLIILRPKFVKGENIDTYFKPLVEELKKLWQTGMHVRDVSKVHEKHHFMLQAILLWMIHDLPMYKVVLRLATKRYRVCPICSIHTISHESKALQKNVYTCQHKRWLPEDHEFCKDLAMFDGVQEIGLLPPQVTVVYISKEVELRVQWLTNGGHPTKKTPAKRIRIKRVSILFELKYWKVLELLKLLKFPHELKFHSI